MSNNTNITEDLGPKAGQEGGHQKEELLGRLEEHHPEGLQTKDPSHLGDLGRQGEDLGHQYGLDSLEGLGHIEELGHIEDLGHVEDLGQTESLVRLEEG